MGKNTRESNTAAPEQETFTFAPEQNTEETAIQSTAEPTFEPTSEPTPGTNSLSYHPEKFVDNLGYMGRGMLVIFVIIGVIILTTLLVNKLFSKKAK